MTSSISEFLKRARMHVPDVDKRMRPATHQQILRLEQLAGPLPSEYVDFLKTMGEGTPEEIDFFSTGDTSASFMIRVHENLPPPPTSLPTLYHDYLIIGKGSLEHDTLYLSRTTGTLHHGDGHQILPPHSGGIGNALHQELLSTLIARSRSSTFYYKDTDALTVDSCNDLLQPLGLHPTAYSDPYCLCAESDTLRLSICVTHQDIDESQIHVFAGANDQSVYEALHRRLVDELEFSVAEEASED